MDLLICLKVLMDLTVAKNTYFALEMSFIDINYIPGFLRTKITHCFFPIKEATAI